VIVKTGVMVDGFMISLVVLKAAAFKSFRLREFFDISGICMFERILFSQIPIKLRLPPRTSYL